MLVNSNVMATIAVKNVEVARKFYEGQLGFEPIGPDEPGVLSYKSGESVLLVYQSQYAGSNKATSATWAVHSDIQDVVATLKDKGIIFEHYDFPNTTRQGDVHVSGKISAAWFKDPDGNILGIVSE